MCKKLTTEDVVARLTTVHADRYDYSKINYSGAKIKFIVICKIHGEFETILDKHENGSNCPKCAYEKDKTRKTKPVELFLEQIKKIHGDKYDYSLIEYINNKTNIKLMCSEHGVFEQTPASLLNGIGCRECYLKVFNPYKNKLIQLSIEFINESNSIHNNKYDYSLVNYKKANSKVKIICPKHGEFEQEPNSHLKGKGCPICNESKGEKLIREYLLSKNIKFIPQHRFKNCRDKQPLPFDFFLPDYNICIEYDGELHFKSVKRFGGDEGLLNRQTKDIIKTNYCKDNGIYLIRISYLENVLDKLNRKLY